MLRAPAQRDDPRGYRTQKKRVPDAKGTCPRTHGACPACKAQARGAEAEAQVKSVRARGAARMMRSVTSRAGPARAGGETPALTGAKRARRRASDRGTRAK